MSPPSPVTWACFAEHCDACGTAVDRLAALIAFERHYLTRHYQRGEAA